MVTQEFAEKQKTLSHPSCTFPAVVLPVDVLPPYVSSYRVGGDGGGQSRVVQEAMSLGTVS